MSTTQTIAAPAWAERTDVTDAESNEITHWFRTEWVGRRELRAALERYAVPGVTKDVMSISVGPAPSTILDVPVEDVPELIDLLRTMLDRYNS